MDFRATVYHLRVTAGYLSDPRGGAGRPEHLAAAAEYRAAADVLERHPMAEARRKDSVTIGPLALMAALWGFFLFGFIGGYYAH